MTSGAPAVPLKIGDLHAPRVLLAILGFLIMAMLLQRRVRGALLIGIAATAVLGYAARLSGKVDNLPGGTNASSYQANNESSVYGSVGLELGVFF